MILTMSIFFLHFFCGTDFFQNCQARQAFYVRKKVRNLEKYILRHYFIIFKAGYQMKASNEDHRERVPDDL